MSGCNIDIGGDETDQGTIAQVVAVETVGTHAGTPNRTALFSYNGVLVPLNFGIPFIAEPALYAAINATDATLVTWAS